MPTALHIEIRGIVQGVGFRPTVHRLATQIGITGWVINDGHGLRIHAEAEPALLDQFLNALRDHPPPAARVTSIETRAVPTEAFGDFQIRPSAPESAPTALIAPDLPVCDACLRELRDPTSSRFRYPYINCTECGPRYSIIHALPYDRARTTMAAWPLCPACQNEYDDPDNRRHHAQPTACHHCGPTYTLIEQGKTLARGHTAITLAVHLLQHGKILAVKGIGGYHLACEAHDAGAVDRLRHRKFRKEKPFAVMARDLDSASLLADLTDTHRAWLQHPARPIILAPARSRIPGLADDSDEIGIMLPYTPLHHLLFDLGAPNPLVMTSANRSSEPIAYRDDDALERLDGLADAFLLGERPIARRVDDSVIALHRGQPLVLRRSRGFAPAALCDLPSDRPILALGADLKNSVTLVINHRAIMSQYIGDLGDLETDRALEQTVHDLLSMYSIDPRDLLLAHDAHPQYVSTLLASRLHAHRRIAVPHHQAHIASVLAERGELDRPVVGIALDGTGFGDDATIWGFEFLVGSVRDGFRREAHLRPALLPGGDAAARVPVQAAAGLLAQIDTPDLRQPPFCFPARYDQARQLVSRGVRCNAATSAGRLIDTVAALCGFTREISYEGQAAIWLEQLARKASPCAPYPFPKLDFRPLLAAILADRLVGRDPAEIAYAFHASLSHQILQTAARLAQESGTTHLALSGGVFQNRLLRTLLDHREGDLRDLTLLFNQAVPPNDGGISLGQAALARTLAQPTRPA